MHLLWLQKQQYLYPYTGGIYYMYVNYVQDAFYIYKTNNSQVILVVGSYASTYHNS